MLLKTGKWVESYNGKLYGGPGDDSKELLLSKIKKDYEGDEGHKFPGKDTADRPKSFYIGEAVVYIPSLDIEDVYTNIFDEISVSSESLKNLAERLNKELILWEDRNGLAHVNYVIKDPIIIDVNGEDFSERRLDLGFKHYHVVKPPEELLAALEEYDENLSPDMFNDIINSVSADALGVSGGATGEETIFTTYMVRDGFKMDVPWTGIYFGDVVVYIVDETVMYIITQKWESEQSEYLKRYLNDNQKLNKIIIYGMTLGVSELTEIETVVNSVRNQLIDSEMVRVRTINLAIRY